MGHWPPGGRALSRFWLFAAVVKNVVCRICSIFVTFAAELP